MGTERFFTIHRYRLVLAAIAHHYLEKLKKEAANIVYFNGKKEIYISGSIRILHVVSWPLSTITVLYLSNCIGENFSLSSVFDIGNGTFDI